MATLREPALPYLFFLVLIFHWLALLWLRSEVAYALAIRPMCDCMNCFMGCFCPCTVYQAVGRTAQTYFDLPVKFKQAGGTYVGGNGIVRGSSADGGPMIIR